MLLLVRPVEQIQTLLVVHFHLLQQLVVVVLVVVGRVVATALTLKVVALVVEVNHVIRQVAQMRLTQVEQELLGRETVVGLVALQALRQS